MESASMLNEIVVDTKAPEVDLEDLIRHIDWGEENRPPTTFSGIRTSYRDRTSIDPQYILSQMVEEGLLIQQIIELNGQEIRETRLNRDHPTVNKILAKISS
jgi:hypothetical protein